MTRTEVLTVTLAAGFLVVFLIPAAAQFRISSKETTCLSNVMRIGYANAVYTSEHLSDPAMPVHRLQFKQCGSSSDLCETPSFIGAYEWGGKSGLGRPGYIEYPGALGSKYGTAAGFGPPHRPLNAILYKAKLVDAYANGRFNSLQAGWDTTLALPANQCPADTGYTGIHFPDFRDLKLSSYDHFGTSYTANMFMIADTAGGEMFSNSPYLHRFSKIPNPARTLAYYENNGRFAWSAQPTPPPCESAGPGIPGTVHGWHGKDWTFNAAFMDGHADRIYMRSYTIERVFEGEAWQTQYQCAIVRGPGWQIDTLPLKPVPTGLAWAGTGRPAWEGGIE